MNYALLVFNNIVLFANLFEIEKAGFDTRYAETKVARKAVNFIDRVATNSEVFLCIGRMKTNCEG